MSNLHCYLCASDEGILLDIFADNKDKNFSDKLETCLSVKIKHSDVQSTKICHKCAYELDGCSQFVQKYRQSRNDQKVKTGSSKGYCCLCFEPGKKGYIFELSQERCLNKSLVKIQELFDDNHIKDHSQNLSICLNCHYNLDVLFDLKKIYQSKLNKLETINEEGIDLKVFPKTKTYVVNRKTTYILVPQINGEAESDTDSSKNMMSLKRKRGRPRKKAVSDTNFRICGECHTCVENGIDMYRYHRTGITVCKDCWLTLDPAQSTNNKRKKVEQADVETGTKLCAVYLEDVLAKPNTSKAGLRGETDGGMQECSTVINVCDSSDSDQKLKDGGRKLRTRKDSTASVDASVADKKKALKRNAADKKSDSECESPKRTRILRSRPTGDEPSTLKKQKTALLPKTRRANGHNAPEKEAPSSKTTKQKSVQQPAKKDTTEQSVSLSDVDKPKIVEQTMNTKTRSRKDVIDARSVTENATTTETKSAAPAKARKITKKIIAGDSNVEKEVRPGRKTRASSYTSEETTLKNRSTMVRRSTKSISTSPQSKYKSSKVKSPKKKSKSDSELEQPYNCKVCLIQCKNKLDGMAHELGHEKQPEVKLQRVAIPEIVADEVSTPTPIEEPEQQSHDVTSTSDAPAETPEIPKSSITDVSVTDKSITEIIEHKKETEEFDKLPVIDETSIEINTKDNDEIPKHDHDKNEDKTNENISDDKIAEESKFNECESNEINLEENNSEETKPETNLAQENQPEKNLAQENQPEKNLPQVNEPEKNESQENQLEKNQSQENQPEEVKLEESKSEEANITLVENDKLNDESSSAEKIDNDELKEIVIAPEADVIIKEKTTEKIIGTPDKPDSAYSKDVQKEEQVVESPINATEESAEQSNTVSVNGNGIADGNESGSETNKADNHDIEKEGDVESETEIKIVDTESPEGSPLQPESIPEKSSIVPEKENEDTDIKVNEVKDAEVKDAEIKNTEATDTEARDTEERDTEARDTEAKDAEVKDDEAEDMVKQMEEDSSTKCSIVEETEKGTAVEESESVTVVTEVLKEVFDLATAEIQKRLEAANPNGGKCTTPVSETLENISREIRNSADMPLLEPIVDDPSSSNRS